jgi:hypothetical protein
MEQWIEKFGYLRSGIVQISMQTIVQGQAGECKVESTHCSYARNARTGARGVPITIIT